MNNPKEKRTWGGARAGSGKKPEFGRAMVVVSCRLTPRQREIFDSLGGITWLRRVLDETLKK